MENGGKSGASAMNPRSTPKTRTLRGGGGSARVVLLFRNIVGTARVPECIFLSLRPHASGEEGEEGEARRCGKTEEIHGTVLSCIIVYE